MFFLFSSGKVYSPGKAFAFVRKGLVCTRPERFLLSEGNDLLSARKDF